MWNVEAATQLKKPRFNILSFQTIRKENVLKNPAEFGHSNLFNVLLSISEVYRLII